MEDRRITETLDLSTVFTFRVPYLVHGIAIDTFEGTPLYVLIHDNEDPSTVLGAERARSKKKILRNQPTQFWILNKVAQPDKVLILRYLYSREDVDVGLQAGMLTNSEGIAIDPATEDKQADLMALIDLGGALFEAIMGEVQETPTAYTELARLKDIATLIGEIQADPTAYTLLSRLKELATRTGEVHASPTANTLLDRLKTIATRTGEVQASPTANTLLDRLKTIATLLASSLEHATTLTIYNLTVASANTEYSQVLPAKTKAVAVHLRDMAEFRLAFVAGKVATPTDPFITIPQNGQYFADKLILTEKTVYVGSPVASKKAEIEVWT